jgi:20S proteasome alpha/beta subunit
MTVIAWDGKTLAADKRCSSNGMLSTVTKVFKVTTDRDETLLVGGSGEPCFIGAMLAWIKAGRQESSFPAHQRDKDDWQPILVIEEDGTPSFYERTPFPIRFEQGCVAIGSGREFARAAMYLGQTARQAVEVACALDAGCGNGIDELRLE